MTQIIDSNIIETVPKSIDFEKKANIKHHLGRKRANNDNLDEARDNKVSNITNSIHIVFFF